MAKWRMRIATNTHTHTHTDYVIPIAFPQQQWLHDRAPFLPYTYIICLVIFVIL